MSLDNIRPGQPPSARALRDAAKQVSASRPGMTSGTGQQLRQFAGGTVPTQDVADLFPAKITEVSGTGSGSGGSGSGSGGETRYGIVEVWREDTGPADRVTPRRGTLEHNWAVSFDPTVVFSVDDLVWARRHSTNADLFELFPIGGTGGGSDASFLAVLTYKSYSDPFITYSWRAVEETGFPGSPLVYTTTEVTSDDEGNGPAYEEDNRDLPVLPTIDSAETGDPGPGVSVEPLCVVRLRRQTPDAGGVYYLFEREPWADLFRRTGESDEFGEIAFHRYYDGSGWQDGREVRLIFAE